MSKIRLGIIGYGNMGSGHTKNIYKGKCPEVALTAIADINPERLELARVHAAEANMPCPTLFDDALFSLSVITPLEVTDSNSKKGDLI